MRRKPVEKTEVKEPVPEGLGDEEAWPGPMAVATAEDLAALDADVAALDRRLFVAETDAGAALKWARRSGRAAQEALGRANALTVWAAALTVLLAADVAADMIARMVA